MGKKIKIRVKKPWIGYPGSTIMQDYGEQPGKGYLLWDIKSRDDFSVTFRMVEHDREFMTIEWTNLKETLEVAKSLARGTRIRVKTHTLIPQVEVRQFINELTTLHGASEVVFKDEFAVNTSTIVSDDPSLQKHDLRDVEVLFKLFKKYLGESTFTAEQWIEVKGLIQKYMTRAVTEDATNRNVRWQLKDLKFDNMFGYGAGNHVNFKKLTGITGVFGPNRVGKSSIIGTLIYVLFNGTDRGALKNLHVINSRKNHCRAKLSFSVDGKNYFVERQSVRHDARGIQHAVTSLNLAETDADGNVIHDLNGEQRTDTEKVLRSLVGSFEDVMLTTIASQGDMNRFIDAGPAHRDLVMSRLLDLLIFEKMSQFAKDDSSLIKAEVKNSPDKNWATLITAREDELQRQSSEILRLERLLKEKRGNLESLKIQLATEYSGDSITHADVDRAKGKIDSMRLKLGAMRPLHSEAMALAVKFDADLNDIKKKIDEIPVNDLKEKLRSISTLKDALARLKQAYEKEKQIFLAQEKSVKRLLDVPCGDQFPNCKYIKDSHADKAKIEKQQEIVNGLLKEIETAEISLVGLHIEKIEAQLAEHSSLLKKESELSIKSMRSKQTVIDHEREISALEKALLSAEMELTDYLSRVVEDDGSAGLKASISELEISVEDLDSKRVKAASRKGSLITEIGRLKEERDRFASLKSQWYVYELFIQATSKKGIPAQIVQMQLPIINAEIARILHGVVDYTLKLEKDIESNSTEIYLDYGDSKRLIELGSGMEKMISSLAIRVALHNATSLPRSDFLIVDEGFGTLDESNIEACNRLLISLKRWFKNIIVISHVDGVKDVTDNMIDISRVGKDSFIRLE